ncbi:hypothetical protein SLEP1_g60231 [Rubroshorea leprosula]|uniref:Uncharacterized protein n=1 Tax=Rubroshorea leprosula TaxID=152421 RepID=A0AAV5MXP3_9ROSI|nr:hypothetical protein SLEP1_g60231 [Rubroshorea leprosula]
MCLPNSSRSAPFDSKEDDVFKQFMDILLFSFCRHNFYFSKLSFNLQE